MRSRYLAEGHLTVHHWFEQGSEGLAGAPEAPFHVVLGGPKKGGGGGDVHFFNISQQEHPAKGIG
jgi:hypothetical protein